MVTVPYQSIENSRLKLSLRYVRRNRVASDQLATLISTIHQAVSGLGKPVAEVSDERTPAVPIRRSVHRDYVVCLGCEWRGLMLRRHLATGHGLTAEQYRARWNLPREHPIIAPGYSERGSSLAKQAGLGRARTVSREEPEPVHPKPRQRLTRAALNWTHEYPAIAAALASLPARQASSRRGALRYPI